VTIEVDVKRRQITQVRSKYNAPRRRSTSASSTLVDDGGATFSRFALTRAF
jgi:hypothetical protein